MSVTSKKGSSSYKTSASTFAPANKISVTGIASTLITAKNPSVLRVDVSHILSTKLDANSSKKLPYTVGNPARTEEIDLKSITLVLPRLLFFCFCNKCTESACPAATSQKR